MTNAEKLHRNLVSAYSQMDEKELLESISSWMKNLVRNAKAARFFREDILNAITEYSKILDEAVNEYHYDPVQEHGMHEPIR